VPVRAAAFIEPLSFRWGSATHDHKYEKYLALAADPPSGEGAVGLRRQLWRTRRRERRCAMSARWKVNITPAERVGRILLGLVGAVGGILLLAGSPTALSGTLEVLLVLAGLDLVVTGATGHCPLYQKLGHMPH
jgi:hypothetical protein